jgi:putative DNA primase/helicase
LIESRQRLVNVLSARLNALNSPVSSSSCSSSSSIASVKPPRTTRHARQRITNHAPRTTENKPLITEPGHLLLDSIRDVLTRYVVLPELAAEALALWVVHTYAFTLREVTTYIGVVSPEKRCGKTTLLELLGRLANRSLTAANISPSALFRVIQDTQPTLLIDEADTFLQGRDELAGILNAGYRKGNAYVVRLSDSRTRWRIASRKPEFGEWTQKCGDDFAQYSCWCPKVMAAIGRLPDTLADRCILITIATQNARRKMRAYAPLESH